MTTPIATMPTNTHAPHTSHTAGPFTATRSAFSTSALAEIHIGTPELTVCVVYSDPQGTRRDEIAANVALLKAAPDLIAALQQAADQLDYTVRALALGHKVSVSSLQNCAAAARAAIARAQI